MINNKNLVLCATTAMLTLALCAGSATHVLAMEETWVHEDPAPASRFANTAPADLLSAGPAPITPTKKSRDFVAFVTTPGRLKNALEFNQNDAYREEISQLTNHNVELATMATKLAGGLYTVGQQRDELEIQLENAREQQEALLGEHSALQGKHTSLAENHETLQGKHATLTGDYQALQGKHATLTGDYQALESAIKNHHAQKTQDEQAKDLLEQQKMTQWQTEQASRQKLHTHRMDDLSTALKLVLEKKPSKTASASQP